MGVYIPLKVRLAKASIPQVVAYIQNYLEENPIPSMDTFAQLIAQFLADHPELVAVASVNSKTGAVILTGADIMLNADADVTLETEVTNLNTMIASLSSQVAQAVATVGGFETDIDGINSDIDTINVALDNKDSEIYTINQTLTNQLNGINANTTKNAQQDTRLTALETALDALETDYNDLNTQVTLHTQQITALQTNVQTNTTDIDELDTRVTALEGGSTGGGLKLYYQQYTLASIAAGSTSAVTMNFSQSIQWSNVMVHAIAQNNACFTNIVPASNTQAGIAVRNVGSSAATQVIVRVYVISADTIEFTLS